MSTAGQIRDLCVCGHERQDHIYYEGKCRPGFICKTDCQKFTEPEPTPQDIEAVRNLAVHDAISTGTGWLKLTHVGGGRIEIARVDPKTVIDGVRHVPGDDLPDEEPHYSCTRTCCVEDDPDNCWVTR